MWQIIAGLWQSFTNLFTSVAPAINDWVKQYDAVRLPIEKQKAMAKRMNIVYRELKKQTNPNVQQAVFIAFQDYESDPVMMADITAQLTNMLRPKGL